MATTIAIVSDTHMPKGRRELPEKCVRICRESDLIVHGGDFMEASILELFKSFGPPVVAVHGNVDSKDLRNWLPETTTIEVESVRIGLIHDSGSKRGRIERMRALFPDHDAVIFGHSHLPLHEEEEGLQIFNPGSPTERRRSPFKSMGVARVDGGKLDFDLIDLGV
ncbi:MAG: metallophosphoesterase family protein [Solirubrobacterales bacterium]|nr:metallophosphoesterase family protein [Solirubrobacterales bacterium]